MAGEFKVPVETVIIEKRIIVEKINTVGTLLASDSINLAFEINGKVKEIFFSEGQPIKQNDILLKLDDNIDQANLKIAQANLKLSELNFQRAEKLYNSKIISTNKYDEALADLQKNQASFTLAKEKLIKNTIRAPFSGILGLSNISIGKLIQAGDTIAHLEKINPLKVEFSIPEKYLNHVKVDKKINIALDIYPDKTFEGTIYAIDPRIDPVSRNIKLKALISNEDSLLRPGNFAKIELICDQRSTLMIPEQAIMKTPTGDMVYVVEEDKVKLVPVKVGFKEQGAIEVASGLNEKDKIVIAGQLKLQPGASIFELTK